MLRLVRSDHLMCIKITFLFGAIVLCILAISLSHDLDLEGRSSNTGAVDSEGSGLSRTVIVREYPPTQRIILSKLINKISEKGQPCIGSGCATNNKNKEELITSEVIPDHPPFLPNLESNVSSTPWKDDPKCKQYKVHVSQKIPEMYLSSYPRSGNTWARYLVEGATGLFTGSMYRDARLYELGYLGEMESPSYGTILLVKDHQFRPKITNDLRPVILLIRNPFDVFISFHAFRSGTKLESFDKVVSAKDFKNEGFHRKLWSRLYVWEKMATVTLEKCRYLHVIVYEDMKSNPIDEVKKVLQFLQIPTDEDRLACLARNVEGKVNRGQPKFNIYSAEEKKNITDAVRRVSRAMEQRGYPPLPYIPK